MKKEFQAVAFAPVIRGTNRLEVRMSGDTNPAEIVLLGSIGKSWWDDSGITEKEFRDARDSVPKGRQINVLVNSEGGSVQEGLGIYNAIRERASDIQVRITGYALSIASVFPLAAKRSMGGRGVVSPESAIWMQHKSWAFTSGNSDDMARAASMLQAHDETMVDIYCQATGKTRAQCRSIMEEETWTKGADAISAGLADETGEDLDAQASYRPLTQEYLARCKAPETILAALNAKPISAAPKQGAANAHLAKEENPSPSHSTTNIMNKKTIVALLKKHGIEATETETEEQLQAKLDQIPAPKVAVDDAKSSQEMKAINDRVLSLERKRVSDKIETFVTAARCTKEEAEIFLTQALANAESEDKVFKVLEAREPATIGGEAAGTYISENEPPAQNENGVQGRAILPELDNIYKAHKEPAARYEAFKREWPNLLAKAFKRDRGAVQASNTFSSTITTNFLIMGVTVKLYNRFAALRLFTRDNSVDPYKPLAAGIMKFNTTTTDGTQVQTDATDFEGLGSGGDSTIDAVTITPHQYTSGGFINNAQLNSGFRVSDIVEAKLVDLAAKVTQVVTTPITTANFVTNPALVSAAAAFGFSELADLQGTLKKATIKNLLLDGEYLARVSNTPAFFQRAGTLGAGDTGAWSAFGWDNIALNTDWSGAGANVRGFACAPQAIGIITGLPLNPPEGIPGNIVMTGTAILQDSQVAIATYAWFSPSSRTFFFTYDIIAGATLLDETAGRLIKSA